MVDAGNADAVGEVCFFLAFIILSLPEIAEELLEARVLKYNADVMCATQAIHIVLREAASTARTLSEFGDKESQQEQLGKACRSVLTSADVRSRSIPRPRP